LIKFMRAAMYYNNSDIRLIEHPIPRIGPGEILVKVFSSGICGTDCMEWYRIKKGPRILGHEIAGEIIESQSPTFKVGTRVFVSHHVPCGACKYCLAGNQTACETLHQGNYDPGGYAEYIRVPKINVDFGTYVLPENVSYDEGTMIEPLACALRAQRLIDVKKNDEVLILGSGISGIFNIQIAKLRGAHVSVSDVNDYRLRKAKEFGADQFFRADSNFEVKADKVIICTGAYEAVTQAFKAVDKKGTVLLFAIPPKDIVLPTAQVWRNEITITSSYGAAPDDLEESLRLIALEKLNVKDMITHRLPLEKIQEGFEIMAKAGESLKVVLEPFSSVTAKV